MLEKKFREFKKKQTEKEFSDASFLEKQAKQLRFQDEALANRIMVRVQNLRNKEKPSVTPISTVQVGVSNKAYQNKKLSDKKAFNTSILILYKKITRLSQIPFVMFVVFPTLLFAFYQLAWATDRYESQAKVIVQQPDSTSTLDASLSLLSGLGVSSVGGSDPQLLEIYIQSNDMLNYLNHTLDLKQYYSQSSIDMFSRLENDATQEDLLEFYVDHITIEIDELSSVISIAGQGFDSGFAQKLTQQIVSRSEWYINNIGHQLADAQLSFIKVEHQLNEDKFKDAQINLLDFQQKHHLLDPTAEGLSVQQIAYGIEGEIASKEAGLKSLSSIMSEHAPRVKAAQNDLEALRKQLANERDKLSEDGGEVIPVSEILAKYTDLKIAMELALQSYTLSKVSLEKSRIESYRQLKYLITVQTATTPEKSTYPDVFYNISLFMILATMLFAIVRLILAVVHELK